MSRLAIVTATVDPERSKTCRFSWTLEAAEPVDVFTVYNGVPGEEPGEHRTEVFGGQRHVFVLSEIVGVVPAFAAGVQLALQRSDAEIICCFHDDVEIHTHGWDRMVLDVFHYRPQVGLAGFGGGVGLGDSDIYQTPYNPMQLARQGFRSNMRDAEAHGSRSTVVEPIVVLDGFSQIGRREYWLGAYRYAPTLSEMERMGALLEDRNDNLFTLMQQWGITHHCYDAALGCFAKRLGWQVALLPVACHHYGGQTAVADTRYHDWARTKNTDGDQGFWNDAHRIVWEQFRDVLPLRLP